jgi:hypothetical protein
MPAFADLIAFETRSFVGAVAEWFVRGFPATAQCNTFTVPGIATTAIPDCQVAAKHQRTVLDWLDCQLTPGAKFIRTGFADSAVIRKPVLLMRVVAERLFARFATTTKSGAKSQSRPVGGCVLDAQTATNEERSIVGHVDCIDGFGLLFARAVRKIDGQRTSWAPIHDIRNVFIGRDIRLAPGITSAYKQLTFCPAALGDVDTQAAIPGNGRLLSRVLENCFLCHLTLRSTVRFGSRESEYQKIGVSYLSVFGDK